LPHEPTDFCRCWRNRLKLFKSVTYCSKKEYRCHLLQQMDRLSLSPIAVI
jgi:hypothetical protein